MSVHVGIEVHRERSQVAVIDQDGEVLANRDMPGGVRGRVRLGMAGRTDRGLRPRSAEATAPARDSPRRQRRASYGS
jgi:hypothetical protein